jgi:hypothetical protein
LFALEEGGSGAVNQHEIPAGLDVARLFCFWLFFSLCSSLDLVAPFLRANGSPHRAPFGLRLAVLLSCCLAVQLPCCSAVLPSLLPRAATTSHLGLV